MYQHYSIAFIFNPCSFHDKESGGYYLVQTVFQVLLQPGTYSVQVARSEGQATEGDAPQIQLEWHAKERTYIVHSVWIQMTRSDE